MIITLRVFLELSIDVLKLIRRDIASAYRASLVLGHLVLDLAPKLVLFLESLHKPISPKAHQMKSVETLVNAH